MASLHFLGETVQLEVAVADPECPGQLSFSLFLDLKLDLVLSNLGGHLRPEVKEENISIIGRDGETGLATIARIHWRDPPRRSLGYCSIWNFVEMNLKYDNRGATSSKDCYSSTCKYLMASFDIFLLEMRIIVSMTTFASKISLPIGCNGISISILF